MPHPPPLPHVLKRRENVRRTNYEPGIIQHSSWQRPLTSTWSLVRNLPMDGPTDGPSSRINANIITTKKKISVKKKNLTKTKHLTICELDNVAAMTKTSCITSK